MANFLFTLAQDNYEKVTRCFQFAKIAAEKGHAVNVFFVDDGVKWADSTRDFTVKTKTGDSANDYLPYLVDNDIPIGV
jgi:sulfur relay (sulfurtransferase) complex TusBCD TusD component (DsrE family)